MRKILNMMKISPGLTDEIRISSSCKELSLTQTFLPVSNIIPVILGKRDLIVSQLC